MSFNNAIKVQLDSQTATDTELKPSEFKGKCKYKVQDSVNGPVNMPPETHLS